MNLWFRLFAFLLTVAWKPKLSAPEGRSILRTRVWPSDLDINLHMNNGRYLTIMDLGRLDIMIRMGLWRSIRRHGWTPVLTIGAIRYRRELKLFEAFEVESTIRGWRDTTLVIEHRIRFTKGRRAGAIAATALVKAGIYDRKARAYVPVERLMREIGATISESPKFTPEMEALLVTESSIRDADLADAQPAHVL